MKSVLTNPFVCVCFYPCNFMAGQLLLDLFKFQTCFDKATQQVMVKNFLKQPRLLSCPITNKVLVYFQIQIFLYIICKLYLIKFQIVTLFSFQFLLEVEENDLTVFFLVVLIFCRIYIDNIFLISWYIPQGLESYIIHDYIPSNTFHIALHRITLNILSK